MEFKVIFRTPPSNTLYTYPIRDGLSWIYKVREKVKELELGWHPPKKYDTHAFRIDHCVNKESYCLLETTITEEEATKSKHFQYASLIYVDVNSGQNNPFNRFVSKEPHVWVDGETGLICGYYLINIKEIVEEWIKAGYPLVWSIK
jgi:hypothetical protein